MNKAMVTGLLGTLAAMIAGPLSVLQAAEEAAAAAPQAYVVLVGIGNYADKQIKPRPFAEADAKALYDLFINPKYLGVKEDHIRLLLGGTKVEGNVDDQKRKSDPATHDNILKALRWAAEKAHKRDDLVVFSFIGQGAPLGDRTCYFASDSTFKDRSKNALSAAEIEAELEKLKSQEFCAFLDVNFKGFDTGKETAPDANLSKFYQEYFGTKKDPLELEDSVRTRGRVVFLATDGLSQSLDLEKEGLFTHAVLEGLKGKADKDGYEPDGLVTVDEMVEFLDKEIPKLIQKTAKTNEEKELRHGTLGGRSSHFVLTHNPAVAAKVKDRLARFETLAKDNKVTQEIGDEGKKLLTQMPKLLAQQELRKSYQKLADGTLTVDKFLKERQSIFDGMKLTRADAEGFARKVLRTTSILRDDYVKAVNQGELVGWAVRGMFRQLNEEIPAEMREKLGTVKEMKEADLLALLADARERLGKREDLDNHKDVNFALQHMLSHLDPYTSYIDPETLNRFKTDTTGKFRGIGIQIRKDIAKDMLRVVTPLKGSPAYRAGIKAGDVITSIIREVDGEGKPIDPPEVISTKGMRIDEAVKKILGNPGTKVKLTLEREGYDKPLEMELTRAEIEMESILGYQRKTDDNWDYYVDPKSQIGYIRITSFTRNTSADLAKVVARLNKQGMKGLILDLRFNPGGLLTSACEVCDLFIDDGLIVTIKPRVGREHSEFGNHEGSYLDFPMVCLINGMSASGSEIVAACLQDHHRAVVMGERSYGKGSVQNIIDMENHTSALKLTTATYWRPSNKNIHRYPEAKEADEWGVSPDKEYGLKLTLKEREDLAEHQHNQEIIGRRDQPAKKEPAKPEFKDKQLDMAMQYLRDQIKMAARVPSKKAG